MLLPTHGFARAPTCTWARTQHVRSPHRTISGSGRVHHSSCFYPGHAFSLRVSRVHGMSHGTTAPELLASRRVLFGHVAVDSDPFLSTGLGERHDDVAYGRFAVPVGTLCKASRQVLSMWSETVSPCCQASDFWWRTGFDRATSGRSTANDLRGEPQLEPHHSPKIQWRPAAFVCPVRRLDAAVQSHRPHHVHMTAALFFPCSQPIMRGHIWRAT